MELILVRHADAEPADGYADDALRPLTRKGQQVQDGVARALARMGLRPQRILTSPRVRAVETAEITSHRLGCDAPQELAVLDGGYRVEALVEALASLGEDTLMCVGHEPDLSTWGGQLLAGEGGARIKFKKSAVLGLGFEGAVAVGRAELRYFYRPKDLIAN